MNFKYRKVKNFWNSVNILFITISVITVAFSISFFIGNRQIIKHSEIVFSILSIYLFFFFLYGLYHGYDILEENVEIEYKNITFGKEKEKVDLFQFASILEIFYDGSLFSFISGIILIIIWCIISVVLGLLLLSVLSFFWFLLLTLLAALNWIFYRALRTVFIFSEKCHGSIIKSLKYSLYFTLGYAGWLSGLLILIDYLS